MRSSACAIGLVLATLAASRGEADDCSGGVREILPPLLLPIEAPQGIAIDETDGSLWIVSAISATVLHVSADFHVLGSFVSPFAAMGHVESGGIAYWPGRDTLLISQPILLEVAEVEKDGTPTGLFVPLNLPAPPNIIPRPYAKGLEVNLAGDGGKGSIWVVESVLSAIYEVSLEGDILASFCAPLDPDGCPGKGAAALVNDVGLFRDAGGSTALELTAGVERRDRIVRVDLDGAFHGLSVPLGEIGGRVGGFARGRVRDPSSGEETDALFVTVESSAELHALAAREPIILPIDSLQCVASAGSVSLAWHGFGAYDAIRVERDGEVIATLPGDSQAYEDAAPPDGVLDYRVVASSGACDTDARSRTVFGAGQVLNEVPFDGLLAVDLTEDASENLWVTDVQNRIAVFDKDLTLLTSFPSPFKAPGDETSGIAFHPTTGTFFVYNAATNEVVEMNDLGEAVGEAFPSGVPSDPEDEAAVTAMLYNPAGAGGAGSFWYLDITRGVIEERARTGELLGSCLHPDQAAEPPPPGTRYDALAWGMAEAPGTNFAELYISGGPIREQRATRILRIGSSACAPIGGEIPTDGIAVGGPAYAIAVLPTTHRGRPVLFALSAASFHSRILEIEVRPPPVPPVRDLACRQPSAEPDVELTFTNPGALDALDVRRGGQLLATLPGDASTYTDRGAPAGLDVYEVVGIRGAGRSDGRKCSLEVGAGSIARRELAGGAPFLHAISRDPTDGTFVAASSLNGFSDSLYRFGPDLKLLESFRAPFVYPAQIAVLAVRGAAAGGGSSEIWSMGWLPGAKPGEQRELPLRATDRTGHVLREIRTSLPPPRGNFVSFPSGMAWDAATDTFWYLERNAGAVVNIALDGKVLSSFQHPAPVHQDGVYNFGIAIDAARNAMYLSSAGRLDYHITKLVELTRGGRLTGVEIPIDRPSYDQAQGFTLGADGTTFVVSAGDRGVWDLVETRAFDPLTPVRALRCERNDGGIALSWENGDTYDAVDVYRDADLVATLPGSAVSFEDSPPAGFYRVVGSKGPFTSAGAICESTSSPSFLRGDVEKNGELNITDAIVILQYLFTGGTTPGCLEAADVDDSGAINITDPVALLGYLFRSGRPPAFPFPIVGRDPTPDALGCES